MATIDGLAMVARARAFVGRAIIPQGMCLNFVWLRAGGLSSIGASVGRMRTAFESWQATPEANRHHGDWDAPIGAVVHYGPSPTRRNKNRNAGDIGISIGGGYGIFTDAAGQGARVGIMSLRARAAQISRPYLGWADHLGGHTIRLAHSATASQIAQAIKEAPTAEEQTMTAHTVLVHPEGQLHIIEGVPVDLGPGNAGSIKVVAGQPSTRSDCSKAVVAEYVRQARKDLEATTLFRSAGGYLILDDSRFRTVKSMLVVDVLTRAGVQTIDISDDEYRALAEQFPSIGLPVTTRPEAVVA